MVMGQDRIIMKEKIAKLKQIWEDLHDVLGDAMIDLGVYQTCRTKKYVILRNEQM